MLSGKIFQTHSQFINIINIKYKNEGNGTALEATLTTTGKVWRDRGSTHGSPPTIRYIQKSNLHVSTLYYIPGYV